MINSSAVYRNTRNLDGDSSLMDVAMECAYFLEQIGALGYRNWDKGEIINGPYVSRFFSTITFMFSSKALPDITVLERLKRMQCKISYETDTYRRVVNYRDESDENAEYFQKVVDHKVWLLTIKIPNRYLALDGNTIMDIDGDDIYYDDIEVVYNDETEESMNQGGGEDDFGGFGDDSGGGDFGGFGDDDMEL